MSDTPSLFGDDETTMPNQSAHTDVAIADWQIEQMRRALDARGLKTMVARQRAVESAAGRSVDSLRALTYREAVHVLARLGPPPAPPSRSSSAWDERDEETWIDKL